MTAGKNKQTGNDLQYQVLRGSSGNMKVIKAGEVDLVVTSPPYFPDEIEPLLRKPLAEQNDYERIEKAITEFALSLRPSFQEVKRVLKPGGAFVVQTKDIRYGQFLVPLIELHLDLAVNSGFRLVSRIHWLSTPGSRNRLPKFSQSRRRGEFRVLDTEVFLVFGHETGIETGSRVESLDQAAAMELVQPLWRMPQSGGKRTHKYGSPRNVVHQLIDLYSEPGELVLDPFVGYGTTMIEARKLGRRAVGYDTDGQCVTITEENLDLVARQAGGGDETE